MSEKDSPEYSSLYFAAKESDDKAQYLLSYADSWFNEIDTNGYLDKLRTMWAAYYGAYYTDFADSHSISFAGEQGELAQLSVNHLRNIARHMHVMVTSNRPALKARATNTDHKSLVQARLANGLLDYYMREKRLENYLKNAVEMAIVLGSSYVKLEWNDTSGEVYDYNEDTETEIREGDVEFSLLSPFDVVFDGSVEDVNHKQWVMCRSFANRHNLIAKYPEFKDRILKLPSKADLQNFHLESSYFNETDLVPIYEFYHKRTEAKEDGNYMLFLDTDIVLYDGPLPYRDLPVYRISPSDIMGTPYGYTDLFDLLPIQDAINSLHSTILTNQNAFGVQNILVPRGADVSISELSGGLNIIEANTQFGDIRPLNLTNTPKEVFNYAQMLKAEAETISGVNSVARGNPESSLKSGTALALVQSNAIQFISGLQQSYIQLIEDVGTGLVNMLKDFASVPRIAMIAGKKNRSYMQEFVGDDLSMINRVIVDVSNPLAQTTAGRVEMAEQLLQMKLITSPEQYLQIINSGNLDVLTEDSQSELDLIKKENETLVEGGDVIAIATDQHDLHVREHRAVLSDPELRKDPELITRTLNHIQEHINLLRNTDPDLLAIIREQPLSPPGGSPANQGPPGVNPQSPPASAMQEMGPLLQPGGEQAQPPGMPNIPTPPAPFQNAPIKPGGNV